MNHASQLHVTSVKSNDKQSIVEFSTPIIFENDTLYFLENSRIVFNQLNGGIDEISLQRVYHNSWVYDKSPKGVPFRHQITKNHLVIKFNQFSCGKMGLVYFMSKAFGEIEIDDNPKDEFMISQEVFITKIEPGGGELKAGSELISINPSTCKLHQKTL